jgi:hypothetical protein
MHDGNFATLNEVMARHVGGGIDRPSRSKLMNRVVLDDQGIANPPFSAPFGFVYDGG